MDRDVHIVSVDPIRFGTLRISVGRVVVIPPDRDWRDRLDDVNRVMAFIADALKIARAIYGFLSSRLRRPRAAAYPSTS